MHRSAPAYIVPSQNSEPSASQLAWHWAITAAWQAAKACSSSLLPSSSPSQAASTAIGSHLA